MIRHNARWRGRGPAGVSAPVVPPDPSFASVYLLMQYEGVDGDATAGAFIDNSSLAHAFTTSATGPEIDTAQKQFGVSSGRYFTAVNAAGLGVTGSNGQALGTADFTIEGWVRFSNVTPQQQFIGNYSLADGNRSWYFRLATGPNLQFAYLPTGNEASTVAVSRSWSPVVNTWYYVAVSRNGADLRLFVDGVQQGATHNIGVSTIPATNVVWSIGAFFAPNSTAAQYFLGHLDEWRVTLGVGRYTSNFTPAGPFPTS